MTTKDIQPLSNHDLEELMNGRKEVQNFCGVFMVDQLPVDMKTTECGILNLDNQNGKSAFNHQGFHWTAWFVKDGTLYYCDSYGCPPPNEIIFYAVNNNIKKIRWNSKQFQKDGTKYCGHVCCYFIMKMSMGGEFDTIIETMINQEKKNRK